MPSLNIDFDDAEMEQIRAAAQADDLSLKKFARAAVLERASMHKRRVAEAARVVAERSAELNRRLA
ncbi:antitoxin Phd [Mycobacterium sp. NPDC003449]